MFVLWHFNNDIAELQGIFDTLEGVQSACETWDCYMEVELNKVYTEHIDSSKVCMYKLPSGKFKTWDEIRGNLE